MPCGSASLTCPPTWDYLYRWKGSIPSFGDRHLYCCALRVKAKAHIVLQAIGECPSALRDTWAMLFFYCYVEVYVYMPSLYYHEAYCARGIEEHTLVVVVFGVCVVCVLSLGFCFVHLLSSLTALT